MSMTASMCLSMTGRPTEDRMKSRKFRQGTRKWKRTGHKTKEWYAVQYGRSGMSMWQRNGK